MADGVIEGRIVGKKKRSEWIALAVKGENDEIPTPVYVSKNLSFSMDAAFMYAVVRLKGRWETMVQSNNKESNDQSFKFIVDTIELIQCAPDPSVVSVVVTSILKGELSARTLLPFGRHKEEDITQMQEMIQQFNSNPKRKAIIATIVRGLEGRENRLPRQCLPHTKRHDLQVLQAVEQQIDLLPIKRSLIKNENRPDKSRPLNVPDDDDTLMSARGPLTRKAYLLNKKHPQVQWMVDRIKLLPPVKHIVDVGGGRGDLAIALAEAFPCVVVTVVDKNDSSIQAGRDFACNDRVHFVHANFQDFVRDSSRFVQSSLPMVDMVVALHACGDLADLAMTYAKERAVPFVICPCCYTKHYISHFIPPYILNQQQTQSKKVTLSEEQGHEAAATTPEFTVVGRLAELNERPDISRRAARAINSMRLHCMTDYPEVHLEEYDSSCSTRNLVMVGIR
jgi:SAM-dependent methyltransferase